MATLRHVVSVHAPVMRVWRLWSTLEGLEQHFGPLETVVWDGDVATLSYSGLFGGPKTLRIQVTDRVEGRLFAFKSPDIDLAGSIGFEAAGQHTYVTFVFSYDPPAKRLGDLVSELTHYPSAAIQEGLRAYHHAMERR